MKEFLHAIYFSSTLPKGKTGRARAPKSATVAAAAVFASLWAASLLSVGLCDREPTPVRALDRSGTPMVWLAPGATLYVPRSIGGRGALLDVTRLTRQAAEAWGVEEWLRIDESSESPVDAEDGLCRLIFVQQLNNGTAESHQGHALTKIYTRAPRSGGREIVEADIVIGVGAFRGSGQLLETQLLTVLIHELGHFLGLDHPCGELDRVARPHHIRPNCRDLNPRTRFAMTPDPLRLGSLELTLPTSLERGLLVKLYDRGNHFKKPSKLP